MAIGILKFDVFFFPPAKTLKGHLFQGTIEVILYTISVSVTT